MHNPLWHRRYVAKPKAQPQTVDEAVVELTWTDLMIAMEKAKESTKPGSVNRQKAIDRVKKLEAEIFARNGSGLTVSTPTCSNTLPPSLSPYATTSVFEDWRES